MKQNADKRVAKWLQSQTQALAVLYLLFVLLSGYAVWQGLLLWADVLSLWLLLGILFCGLTAKLRPVCVVGVLLIGMLIPHALVTDYGVLQGHYLRTFFAEGVLDASLKTYFVTLLFLALLVASIWLLFGQYTRVGFVLLLAANSLVALCNVYLLAFRGSALQWADGMAWAALPSVILQYPLYLNTQVALLVLFWMWSIAVVWCGFSGGGDLAFRQRSLGSATVLLLWVGLFCLPWSAWVSVSPDYWASNSSFWGNFILQMRSSTLQQPAQYAQIWQTVLNQYPSDALVIQDEQKAGGNPAMDELAAEQAFASGTARNAATLPDVIVIMNESYADFSAYAQWYGNTLSLSAEVYQPLYDIMQGCCAGVLVTPVYGANTANTEFEFLSGLSMAFRADVPYATCFGGVTQNKNVTAACEDTVNTALATNAALAANTAPSDASLTMTSGMLPSVLGACGYTTVAMHPNIGTAWNRTAVYQAMGFDAFYTLQDAVYMGAQQRAGFVTDASNYDAILTVLDTLTAPSQPSFIFNVTIANHGGYQTSRGLPAVDVLQPVGEYPQAEHYLALLRQSTQDLAAFLQALQNRARPCVVVFFGDHKPSVEPAFYQALSGQPFALGQEALYHTPFFIWSNQGDITQAGLPDAQSRISSNYLSLYLLQLLGLPQTGQQKLLWQVYQQYPVLSPSCVIDAAGNTVPLRQALSDSWLLKAYQVVNYNQLQKGALGGQSFYQYAKATS